MIFLFLMKQVLVRNKIIIEKVKRGSEDLFQNDNCISPLRKFKNLDTRSESTQNYNEYWSLKKETFQKDEDKKSKKLIRKRNRKITSLDSKNIKSEEEELEEQQLIIASDSDEFTINRFYFHRLINKSSIYTEVGMHVGSGSQSDDLYKGEECVIKLTKQNSSDGISFSFEFVDKSYHKTSKIYHVVYTLKSIRGKLIVGQFYTAMIQLVNTVIDDNTDMLNYYSGYSFKICNISSN